jgi:hypothetical protein
VYAGLLILRWSDPSQQQNLSGTDENQEHNVKKVDVLLIDVFLLLACVKTAKISRNSDWPIERLVTYGFFM